MIKKSVGSFFRGRSRRDKSIESSSLDALELLEMGLSSTTLGVGSRSGSHSSVGMVDGHLATFANEPIAAVTSPSSVEMLEQALPDLSFGKYLSQHEDIEPTIRDLAAAISPCRPQEEARNPSLAGPHHSRQELPVVPGRTREFEYFQ